MKRLFYVCFLFLPAIAANAQVANDVPSLIGPWSGKLNTGGISLTIVVNFEQHDGYVSVTLDSPDQGAKGIGAYKEYLSEDSVAFKIDFLGMSYRARRRGDELAGTFTQNGFSLPLVLKRGKYEMRRPQEPKPPFPYSSEEVTFRNEKASATLSGTLTYPVGYDCNINQKPVVLLLVSGSGLQNRDEELMGHKPFLLIADYLARHGIATLRYDDRTYGQSVGGDAQNATTEDFMEDAMAGMDYLRSLKRFGKVGCLGHSEGGAIAFMLASRKKTDFIISMAGPGVKGDTLLAAQENYILQLSGQTGMTTTAQLRQSEEVKKLAWLRWFIDYDPSSDIRKTRCPAFVINGDHDTQVISSLNLTSIKKLLPHSKKNVIKEYPKLNHLFQSCDTGLPTEYNSIEETISPVVLSDIVKWIDEMLN